MAGMFQNATSFNQDLSLWITSKLSTMECMFYHATSFNQNISHWDVKDMSKMFESATSFDHCGIHRV
jgi:Mycoplasma protein of unknown function, DUF285